MSTRSPSGTSSPVTGSTDFRTGVLSPVSAASSISSVAARTSRPSAGTLSPASKVTMSPGTSSSAGMSARSPPRRTCAWIRSIFCSAATLSAALPSWFRPRTAFRTVRPMITRPVDHSCSATMLTTAAPRRTSCMRSRYCRRKACQPGSFFASASLFGPTFARRRSTSAASSPLGGSTLSCAHASPAVRPCQLAGVPTGQRAWRFRPWRRSFVGPPGSRGPSFRSSRSTTFRPSPCPSTSTDNSGGISTRHERKQVGTERSGARAHFSVTSRFEIELRPRHLLDVVEEVSMGEPDHRSDPGLTLRFQEPPAGVRATDVMEWLLRRSWRLKTTGGIHGNQIQHTWALG